VVVAVGVQEWVFQRDRSDWDGNAAGVDDCLWVRPGKLNSTFQISDAMKGANICLAAGVERGSEAAVKGISIGEDVPVAHC
jgi:hypothetical protein